MTYDCLIAGAGFSGSLLAMILATRGRSVLLIDRASHPRFAIGESSTPIADLLLEKIAHRWDLAELAALARFGSWQETYPNLRCGLKRGFSYFRHHRGAAFHSNARNANQMLVAASPDDNSSDTHWYRADVDNFLVHQAQVRGVRYLDRCRLTAIDRSGDKWSAQLMRSHSGRGEGTESIRVAASFIVDASGGDGSMRHLMNLQDCTARLRTHTYARFGHVDGVRPWATILEDTEIETRVHPFICDHAAVHHLLDDGWLWMLRFLDGTTSVGRVWHATQPSRCNGTLIEDLDLSGYATLCSAFDKASVTAPPHGLRGGSARLQRWTHPLVGDRWALLPSSAVTLDPLHSTGIAMGIAAVWRLAEALLESISPRPERLDAYACAINQEIALLDLLVDGAYRAMPDFDLFCSYCLLYIALAIQCEEKLANHQSGTCGDDPLPPLWLAGDRTIQMLAKRYYGHVVQLTNTGNPSEDSVRTFTHRLRRDLAPWNSCGLIDGSAHGMYRYTGDVKTKTNH